MKDRRQVVHCLHSYSPFGRNYELAEHRIMQTDFVQIQSMTMDLLVEGESIK